MKKNILSTLGLFVLLQGVGLSNDIVFTGPNQTIEVTQDRGWIGKVSSKWENDSLALYYPKRDLSKGFKDLKFGEVYALTFPLTFVIYANPNSSQTIEGNVYFSDFFSIHVGDADRFFFLKHILHLGQEPMR